MEMAGVLAGVVDGNGDCDGEDDDYDGDGDGCDDGDDADTVKTLHAHLRAQVSAGHDPREVWSHLLADSERLRSYSVAMRRLATGRWRSDGHEASRITWCVQTCREYFGKGHGLEKYLLKDLRRVAHGNLPIVTSDLLPGSEVGAWQVVEETSACPWTLLDVGSCFNPFRAFQDFKITALDIAPADDSVLRCDFLSVVVTSDAIEGSGTITPGHTLSSTSSVCHPMTTTTTVCSSDDTLPDSSTLAPPVSATPTSVHASSPAAPPPASAPPLEGVVLCAGAYQVVVFSLFLSYLPRPRQRLECCVKAHQLLRPHGLLLVVTPDSSHQNRRVDMMKSWKASLEKIGFHRCKYSKLTHLHCMAFRKVTMETVGLDRLEQVVWEGLYIPQDKQQLQEENGSSAATTGVGSGRELLSELPYSAEVQSD